MRRAELTDSETSMTAANDLAVRRALEGAGVEFIDENGGGPGSAPQGKAEARDTEKIDSWRSATSTPGKLQNEPKSVLQYSSSLFGSRVFSDVSSAWCHDEGAPPSTLHADKIVIIARGENTPALGAHEPADAREAGLLGRPPLRF